MLAIRAWCVSARCPGGPVGVMTAGSHATESCEPSQVREEAALSGQFRVPWGCLAELQPGRRGIYLAAGVIVIRVPYDGQHMTYASLYQKYRPGTFDEVIGQEHVTRTLRNAVEHDQVFHAYLFSGPRGTGKTSTARILARALNCEDGPTATPCGKCRPCIEIAAGSFPDVFEIDAATHSKVEEAREFLAGVPTGLTAGARRKLYIIDEVHMLSTHAFNALLKTLEEPPGHVVFILATTEPHKVPPTVAGRCQSLEFRLVSPQKLAEHYIDICEKEGVKAEAAAIEMIARQAGGSVRDGLSLLDQTITAISEEITVEAVLALTARSESETVAAVIDAVAAGDPARCFKLIGDLVDEGRDIRHFVAELNRYFRAMLVSVLAPSAPGLVQLDESAKARVTAQADLLGEAAILRGIDLCGAVMTEAASGGDARFAIETALVRMARPATDPSPAALLQRIEQLERLTGSGGAPASSPRAVPASGQVEKAVEKAVEKPVEAPTQVPASKATVESGASSAVAKPAPESAAEGSAAGEGLSESVEAEQTPVSPAALGEAPDFDYLLRMWPEFLQALRDKRKQRLHALLAEGRPIALEGNDLIIGFGPKHQYHAESLMNNRDQFDLLLAEVYSAPLRIQSRIVEFAEAPGSVDATSGDTSSSTAPASDVSAEPPDSSGRATSPPTDTSEVGVVDLVREAFAAEVVEEYRSE